MKQTLRLFLLLVLSLLSLTTFGTGADIPDYRQKGWASPVDYRSFERCYQFGQYPGHVGDDLCRDVGTPVHAIADGCVQAYKTDASNYGGVGKLGGVTLLRHKTNSGRLFYAVYGHATPDASYLEGRKCADGSETVRRGDRIATVHAYEGDADHLHFGIHPDMVDPSGMYRGNECFTADSCGWLEPFGFLNSNTPFSSGPSLRYCGQISATETLCWDTKDSADITCESGSNWIARNNENAWSYPADKSLCSLLGCYPRTTSFARFFTANTSDSCLWKEGGSDAAPSPPSSPTTLPNLQIEEITVHTSPEGTNTRLVEETTLMNVGGYYQINVWPVSNGTDCQNGNFTGNPDFEVKTDLLYQIAQSVDDGAWKLLKRSETHCKYLVENDSKKEMIAFTVPPGSEGKRLYLKAKVDATGSISETDDNDNQSDIEWYPIRGDCNLTISSARLTGHRVSLTKGESYGFAATLLNQGPDACPRDTRLSYFFKKPGDADFRYADGDDTPSSKLLPNQSTEEWMKEDTLIADTVGTHEARVCADTNLANEETDEGDNCYVFFYDVLSPPPSNITVTDPPTGATWRCSSSSEYRYIRWSGVTYEQSPTVELWFSKDDGNSWKLIDPAVSNDGKYRWYMCKSSIGSDSSNGRVKVVAKAASGVSGRFFIDYARGCK